MPRTTRNKLRSGFRNEHAVKARAGELDAYDQIAVVSCPVSGGQCGHGWKNQHRVQPLRARLGC